MSEQEEVIKTVNRLFAIDTLIMGVLLTFLGWGGIQIISSKEAIAKIQEQGKTFDKNTQLIEESYDTVIRLEISQEYFNRSINKDISHLKTAIDKLSPK